MPRQERHKTNYPGVYYIVGTHPVTGKPERIYYITYRLGKDRYEEKAGRQFQDDMTPARASLLRARKINREILPNAVSRESEKNTPHDATFANLIKLHLDTNTHLKRPKEYQYWYDTHLKKTIDQLRPVEITQHHIDSIVRNMRKKYKPQTIKHALGLIVRLTNFGVDRNLCEPLRIRIKMPKYDNTKTEMLTPDQITAYLKALDEEPDIQVRGIVKLALSTGMRKGELLKLQWNDVNFENKFIVIRNPKGVVTENIPMNEHAESVLRGLRDGNKTEYVFPSPKGVQRDRGAFSRQLRKIRENAGLPDDFRPLHGARHTFASTLASSGVDIYTIQKLLGHKTPRMTQRYAHLQDETLRKAAKVMDKKMG